MTSSKIITALDFESAELALAFVDTVSPEDTRLKVGNELFTAAGPALIGALADKGFDVFLDLKYHDIPNTVASAVKAAANLGVWMVNVHTLGGPKMLTAAAEALANFKHRPLLIGVTVLTSMDEAQLKAIGLEVSPPEQVKRLASLCRDSGLDGVVSSAWEVPLIKERCGSEFICVTPGIRPKGAATGDQSRIMTPEEAVRQGSDYLVIGRPITRSENPAGTLAAINSSLA